MSRADMAALRQDEQRAAAAVVGVSDVRFLGHPDGMVAGDPRAAPRHQPGHPPGPARAGASPSRPSATGSSSTPATPTTWPPARPRSDAVYPDARNPFAHPELLDVEGLEPWSVPELWIMGPGGRARRGRGRHHGHGRAQGGRAPVPQEPDAATPTAWRSGSATGRVATAELAGLPEGSLRRALPGHPHPLRRHGRRRPLAAGPARGLRGPGRDRPRRRATPAPT